VNKETKEMIIEIKSLQDAALPLHKWKELIETMIEDFGKDTVLYTDGGYNNVSMKLRIDDITKKNL
jgi:hypothetical protein